MPKVPNLPDDGMLQHLLDDVLVSVLVHVHELPLPIRVWATVARRGAQMYRADVVIEVENHTKEKAKPGRPGSTADPARMQAVCRRLERMEPSGLNSRQPALEISSRAARSDLGGGILRAV